MGWVGIQNETRWYGCEEGGRDGMGCDDMGWNGMIWNGAGWDGARQGGEEVGTSRISISRAEGPVSSISLGGRVPPLHPVAWLHRERGLTFNAAHSERMSAPKQKPTAASRVTPRCLKNNTDSWRQHTRRKQKKSEYKDEKTTKTATSTERGKAMNR